MTYRLVAAARRDIADAIDHYDRAASGLGLKFLDELERAILRIVRQPNAWTRVSENHRRARLRRFPYGIIYSVVNDEIVISAVFHSRRRPEGWKDRK
jgi:plasmid stabilization system protein ParE